MIEVKEATYNFADSDNVSKQLKWTDSEIIKCTKNGLEWEGPRHQHRGVRIELTEAIPAGWSWRTVTWVSVSVTVQTDAPVNFYSEGQNEALSKLHIRYSCDASTWTDWKEIVPTKETKVERSAHAIGDIIHVPKGQYEPYLSLLSEYQQLDVDWPSDEEAIVKWILNDKDRHFFEKYAPFIGYVQFAIETSLPGSTPIRAIDLKLVYQAGGFHTPPKDKSMYDGRNGTWRFTAQKFAQETTATPKSN